ncbi:transposase [Candidatus Falkowbacteria bacterium]|nr:transposase [Candidatus Falkowbacteria bacterium]
MKLHRNSQKRFIEDIETYFITTTTKRRFPFFKEEIFCELFIDNLRLCKEMKKFTLYGFSILYDYVHLLIEPGEEFNISRIMQFLKRHFSRDMNCLLTNEGGLRESRLQGGGYKVFSEIVQNHDNKLKNLKNKFLKKYSSANNPSPKFMWQESFYDHVIRGNQDFSNHREYIFNNCCKHRIWGNPEAYRWSDANPEWHGVVDVAWE